MKTGKLLMVALVAVLALQSCKKPIKEDVTLTLRNTLQDPSATEQTYSSLFGQSDDAYDETAVLSNDDTEFPTALAQNGTPAGDISGLYNIEFTEKTIDFTLLPSASDPFWQNVFGVFPAGKFDRYYFTLSEDHNISGFTSNNSSVNLRLDSDKVIVVEIGEGYDMNPGVSFSIELEK